MMKHQRRSTELSKQKEKQQNALHKNFNVRNSLPENDISNLNKTY